MSDVTQQPSETTEAESIRQQSHHIRQRLVRRVEGVKDNAQRLLDWRQYVQAHPWAAIGIAAGVGYLLVPQRVQVVRPDSKTLESIEALRDERPLEQPTQPRQSALANVLDAAGHMALRTAVVFAGQKLAQALLATPAVEDATDQEVTDGLEI